MLSSRARRREPDALGPPSAATRSRGERVMPRDGGISRRAETCGLWSRRAPISGRAARLGARACAHSPEAAPGRGESVPPGLAARKGSAEACGRDRLAARGTLRAEDGSAEARGARRASRSPGRAKAAREGRSGAVPGAVAPRRSCGGVTLTRRGTVRAGDDARAARCGRRGPGLLARIAAEGVGCRASIEAAPEPADGRETRGAVRFTTARRRGEDAAIPSERPAKFSSGRAVRAFFCRWRGAIPAASGERAGFDRTGRETRGLEAAAAARTA